MILTSVAVTKAIMMASAMVVAMTKASMTATAMVIVTMFVTVTVMVIAMESETARETELTALLMATV